MKYIFLNLIILFVIYCTNGCTLIDKKVNEWNEGDGYRWASLLPEGNEKAGFEKISSSKTNVTFKNVLTKDEIARNRHYLNGSGVAVGDVDGDGWLDIYFASLNGPNKLYKNEGGFRFVDITESAGVSHEGYYSTGVVFADIDGDGDLDLIVSSMEKQNVIYLNDGTGNFERLIGNGLSESKGSQTLALADIDADGDLDLYITNYKEKSAIDLFNLRDLNSQNMVQEDYNPNLDRRYTLIPPFDEHFTFIYNKNKPPDRREIGRKDELFINNGNGTFEKVLNSEQYFFDHEGNPLGLQADWGLSAKFHDINQDGYPDLYVCNDFWTKDRIWINQGNGTFREMDPLAIRDMSYSSMGVDFSDVNRDGFWDIFVSEMLSTKHERRLRQMISEDPNPTYIGQYSNQPQYNRNSFYLNRSDNTFSEISYFSGLEASEWSWTTKFIDVDLDGYEDLLISTGYSFDFQDLDAQDKWRDDITKRKGEGDDIFLYPSLELPNMIFRNNGDLTFTDQSKEWGFVDKDISHGMALGDFDNDGDLDLVINRLNEEGIVYKNKTTAPRIAVRLIGTSPNTQAIGAKVELQGGAVSQQKIISAGGDYLSHSDPLIVFAANKKNKNHKLTISWPDGMISIIDSIEANRIYEIYEDSISKKTNLPSKKNEEKYFLDVSEKISHNHYERPYDDFIVQPLLPTRLSRQGPGVSWIDFDSDGDDDLFISSGRDGNIAVYENKKDGNFESISLQGLTKQTNADQTTILGWKENQHVKLLIGNANYEPADISAPSVRSYSYKSHNIVDHDSIPGIFSTTGVLAAADYDGDGNIDLFVGGRFVPTFYPMDATSRSFVQKNGQFVLDENGEMGLVTGAVFSDYDQDGDQDLFLSLEWGTIRLFENRDGELYDVTRLMKLDRYKGWWNGIATGDFNNDGKPDIIATNWGLNSPYQIDSKQPIKMYYQDINRNNKVDIIESYYDKSIGDYVPRRQLREYKSISGNLASNIRSNKEFANSSLNEILGINIEDHLRSKEINTLRHMVFINEGDSFKALPLPMESQFSAAFYAGVADFDNDGNEDIFLSQNFFQVRHDLPRLDAGRGLWLKGNGQGKFEAIPGQISGIEIYGEQRAAALSDYNGDFRVDIAVSQNGAETKLYKNIIEKKGLGIRLEGPNKNRDGIGSSIRLVYEDSTKGPRREIQAGSGYWSQNSTTQIMGIADSKDPNYIEVSWFDGVIDTVEVEHNTRFYRIAYPQTNNR